MVPRLETLPEAQRILWPQLSAVGTDFVLYGGTALSLQVGGRISVDFDFFSALSIEPDKLEKALPFLKGAELRQQARNTATFFVGKGRDSVAISFFGGLGFGRVSTPVQFSDNRVYAAGLLDLAAQKVKVIQSRATAKDYQDIHKLLSEGITLELALGAARALYPEFNPAISLKALSYFSDVPHLSADIQRDLKSAASRVREVTQVSKQCASLFPDLGPIARERQIELEPDL
jgi:Nucleotidyl transferase AbiEii toxin, Type IV TA system